MTMELGKIQTLNRYISSKCKKTHPSSLPLFVISKSTPPISRTTFSLSPLFYPSNNAITSSFPFSSAISNAVSPNLFVRSLSAPFARSTLMTFSCPLPAAVMRGVSSFSPVFMFGSPPALMRSRTRRSWPYITAVGNGRRPRLSARSCRAPKGGTSQLLAGSCGPMKN